MSLVCYEIRDPVFLPSGEINIQGRTRITLHRPIFWRCRCGRVLWLCLQCGQELIVRAGRYEAIDRRL